MTNNEFILILNNNKFSKNIKKIIIKIKFLNKNKNIKIVSFGIQEEAQVQNLIY